jgi:hypothetical protein
VHYPSLAKERGTQEERFSVRVKGEAVEFAKRLLLIGRTDGGRLLTLVIERTADPTTWLIVTGWSSTGAERKILERRR